MNTRTLMVATALACLSTLGVAHADTSSSKPVDYHYGMPLHIARVTGMDEPLTQVCEVVQAELYYTDTAGQPQAITYLKQSDACNRNQN